MTKKNYGLYMMTYLAKIRLHLFELNNPKKKKKDRRRKKKKKVNAQIDSFVITTAAYILHTHQGFLFPLPSNKTHYPISTIYT
jgi:hypothetical protein